MMNEGQAEAKHLRELSEEERKKLEEDVNVVSEFKQKKLESEAKKNWDLFYKRNTTKFFKDRHWTTREFTELLFDNHKGEGQTEEPQRIVFEVGCGVGNLMFPLLEEDPYTRFYACDFSPRAVEFVKSNPLYNSARCTAFTCDITQDDTTATVPSCCVDIVTLIFVLSAIHPEKMVEAVKNVAKTLKQNGVLLIRDYGLYDHAMLRFSKGHKLSEHFYVRQDGTRAFYFSLEKLNSIMEEAGLTQIESSYIERKTVNKKEGVDVARIFVQAKYNKKMNESTDKSSTPRVGHMTVDLENTPRLKCVLNSECKNDFSNTVQGKLESDHITSATENLTLDPKLDTDLS